MANPAPSTELPQYPDMIMSAIEVLAEKEGSNKTSISKQIESTHGNLPPAHTTLLTHHLNRMKSSGQLIFSKNNYMKPDPNAPPRRGRGRPPKPKTPLPPGVVPPPPRPRGRPPKESGESSVSVSGKKRGRPAKSESGGGAPAAAEKVAAPAAASGEVKRGRGRPPKEKTVAAATVGA